MPTRKQRQVWLVENCGNSPGQILAVFDDEEDAINFANQINEPCNAVPRTLFYGQPPIPGYNQ